MSVRFDHIVSLGSDCDVALQLERKNWFHTRSVFDWLITPWDGMMSVLAERGARLATDFIVSHDGLGVACVHHNVVYWHEFERDEHKMPIVTPQQVARTRDKLRYKMDRMDAACRMGGSVLFVRSGIVTNVEGDRFAAGEPFTGDHLDGCAGLIEHLYPGLRFSLLMIYYPGHDNLQHPAPQDPRIVLHEMTDAGGLKAGHMTRASDTDWDLVLAQIPYGSGR